VERRSTIVGEEHQQWRKIIHFYFGIDYDVVWDTVKTDIPVLEQSIRVILSDQSNLLRSYTTID
jgi:uncharacterized protein with HEPN domain